MNVTYLFRITAMALFIGSQCIVANTIPFSGNLPSQNALFVMNFTLIAPDSMTAQTTSWDRPATFCTTCGFDPILWLFNADTGALLVKNDDIEIIVNHLDNPTNDPNNPA